MKPTKEQIEAYKSMAQSTQPVMEDCVRKHLEENCLKYKGHEDKFDRCIAYLVECAKEILDGHDGDVPDDVCYRICADYFDDEIWKQEDEEKAKEKQESDRMAEKYNSVKVPEAPKKPTEKQLDFFAAMGV